MSSAPTDVEAQAIELAGFPARDDHGHHLPGKVVDRDAILPTTARLRELAPGAREIAADLDLVLRAVKIACAVVAQPTTIPVADIPLTARRGLSPCQGQILERLLAGSDADAEAEAHRLTPREWEVLHLLAQRASDPEIAVALGVALSTARSWSASVRSKLGVRSRRALSPRPLRNV
jgi:ATP/maltotriose-dependent transcriptional regulator MalT